jgi:geranylgeranyl diphosphate synthase type II
MQTVAARRGRIASLKARVERRLGELVPLASPDDRLGAAMSYALSTPGKRLRPLIVLLVADELDGEIDDALDPACAVEMVHAASLILDDLPCMDDAALRRGLPSTHARYGEATAVLAAVALLNLAFAVVADCEAMPDTVRVEMVQALSAAVGRKGLAGGQEADLHGGGQCLATLRETHHRQTGVLFMASAMLGGLAGGASVAEGLALERFAAELGLAFQARDDVADAGEDGACNVIGLLGADGALAEAARRLASAKQALVRGGERLAPLNAYVELLMTPPRAPDPASGLAAERAAGAA